MVKSIPILKDMTNVSYGFYDLIRLSECPLSGIPKSCYQGSFPEAITRIQIVGNFLHELIFKTRESKTTAEILAEAKSLMLEYKTKYSKFFHLNQTQIEEWSEISEAMRFCKKRIGRISRENVVQYREEKLTSGCGNFVGRPDLFSKDGENVKLVDYKSGLIFKDGLVDRAYEMQLKFYSFLIFESFIDVLSINARLVSPIEEPYDVLYTREKDYNKFKSFFESILHGQGRSLTLELDARPSIDACKYCDRKVVCEKFLEFQTNFPNTYCSFIVKGILGSFDIGKDCKFLRIGSYRVRVGQDFSLTNEGITAGKEYLISNLAKSGGDYIFTSLSIIYEC